MIQYFFVFFIILQSFPILAFASWEDIEHQYQQHTNELRLREKVEKDSYSFTKSLCVLFKFRYKTLEKNNTNRQLLINSLNNWDVVILHGAKAAYADSEYHSLIFFQSNFLHRLYTSNGYDLALTECANEIGISKETLKTHFKDQAYLSNAIGNALATFLGGGIVVKSFKFIAKTEVAKIISQKMKPLTSRFKRYKNWIIGTLTVSGLTVIGYYAFEDYNLLYKILGLSIDYDQESSKTNSANFQQNIQNIHAWAKTQNYHRFAKAYLEHNKRTNCNVHDCELPEELMSQFIRIKKDIKTIRALHNSMSSIVDNNPEEFFALLATSLEKNSQDIELNKKEKWSLNFSKDLGSMKLIIDLVEATN